MAQEQKINENQKAWKLHKKTIVIAIIVAVIAIIWGIKYFIYWMSYQSTDDAFIAAHVSAISPRVPGHVLKVYVDDNQMVTAGALLVELDPNDLIAKLDAQKAALEGARAAAQRAEIDLKRYQQLVAKESAPEQRLDYASADSRIAEAKVLQTKADLEQAQLNLSYTKIYAPVTGRVTNKTVEKGEYVTVGQPLMAIVESKPWVVANYKETQLTHMRPGQRATITVDAYPGKKLKAHVDSIQAGTGAQFSLLPPENATGNYVKVVQRVPVKIVFDEDPNNLTRLAPGMSVVPEVRIAD